jgi:hypothetical protein
MYFREQNLVVLDWNVVLALKQGNEEYLPLFITK